MALSQEIKKWIGEVRGKHSIPEDAILIQRDGPDKTRIVLLAPVCCAPVISIEKRVENINREDILEHADAINHRHNTT